MKSFALVVFIVSFALASLLAPTVIRKLRELKFGQKILEDGPTWHFGKQNTPIMGGIIFMFACAFGILCAASRMISSGEWRPLFMLALSLVFGAVGFVDD